MYSFEFKSKLRLLNDSLYVDDSKRTPIAEGFFSTALCIRKGKRAKHVNYNYAHNKESREYLHATNSGMVDDFLGGVPLGWIPEFDMFDLETGKLLARGWRTTLLMLARKKHISLDKARRVFQCNGLGLDHYDFLTLDTKVRWARGHRYSNPSISKWDAPKYKLSEYGKIGF